jgi:hypothetical protein
MTTFIEWLEDHRGGLLDAELTDALAEVVAAVSRYGKTGSVTLTINVAQEGRTIVVSDRVARKAPEESRMPAIYFADAEGGLHRDDPYQQRLPLEQTPTIPLGELRVVDTTTGEIREAQENHG